MRIILFFLVSFIFVSAQEKLLITHFENLKPYYYNHQMVDLRLKIISAKNGKIEVFDDQNRSYEVKKVIEGYMGYLYFPLNNKFPKFRVVIKDDFKIIGENNISVKAKIKKLYPPKQFCGVLANKIKITDKILTNYDENSNMVYWTITGIKGNTKKFHLNYKNEKLYFLDSNNTMSSYSYSAIVPFSKRDFEFNYFNLKDEKYHNIKFHIDIKNEIISTQTDIKPMAKSNRYIINAILIILLLLWGILYFYKRKIIYIILMIIVLTSLVFLNKPKKEIVLPEGTKIHILPFPNSTVFLITAVDTRVKILDKKDGYEKIEFNKYIGWIKDE